MEATTVVKKRGDRRFSEHPHSNDILDGDPTQIPWGSHKFYTFQCGECAYVFTMEVRNITLHSRWCLCCSSNAKQLCDREDCKQCESKSLAAHPRIEFWSKRNTLSFRQVHKGSETKVWFDCNVCHHSFCTTAKLVSSGYWCNYCSSKKLCDDFNCKFCFDKSFASHPYSINWSDRNEGSAREVFLNSNYKYWFDCPVCFHTFEIRLLNITQQGHGCNICCNRERCGNSDCKFCFDHSFASHPTSQLWSAKNKLAPINVALNSEKLYWFHCPDCNCEYQQSPQQKVLDGKKCPDCSPTTEKLLFGHLQSLLYFFELKSEKYFSWSKNSETGRYLRYDIAALEMDQIFEIDGDHHFKQVTNWGDLAKIQERDNLKMRLALQHGFRIIRIYQPDVWFDVNWAIAAIEEAMKSSDKVVFISKSPDRYNGWNLHKDLW